MKAGRELDALVAEKVMGWKPPDDIETLRFFDERYRNSAFNPVSQNEFWLGFNEDGSRCLMRLPYYSTDIAAAWEILEHFRLQDKGLLIEADKRGYTVTNANDFMLRGWDAGQVFEINAATAPLAICLAALKAVGVKIK